MPFGGAQMAGGVDAFHPLHLNKAQPASAGRLQIGMVAEMRNIDSRAQGRVEHRRSRLRFHFLSVDLQLDHRATPSLTAVPMRPQTFAGQCFPLA